MTPHTDPFPRRLTAVLAGALALLLVTACGADDDSTPGDPSSPASSPAATAIVTPQPPATPEASDPPSAAASQAAPSATPGGPTAIRPADGDVLSVVGVAHDDVLNLRRGPGVAFPVVATLPPLADDVTATGRGWLVRPGAVWYEVSHSGVTGWANGWFLAWRDGTEDVTSHVVARIGQAPVGDTMADLGLQVARALVSGPERSTRAMSVAPSAGEVSYDIVGLSDDSVWAQRLRVRGQPNASGQGFSLTTVEATSFCMRGVGSGGLCP